MPSKSVRDWNVDFDQFLNPFIPPPPRNYLPHFILHFLGYRQPDHEPSSPLGNVLVSTWAFLGTLASLSLVYILCHAVPLFQNLDDDVPMILGSFVSTAPLIIFPKRVDIFPLFEMLFNPTRKPQYLA